MFNCTVSEQPSHALQVLHDDFISVLDVLSLILRDLGEELAVLIDRHRSLAWLDDAISDASGIIILTEAWSAVDDTSTSAFSDEAGTEDLEAAISSSFLEEVEQGLVALSNDCSSFELFKDGMLLDLALLEHVVKTIFHTDVDLFCGWVLPAHVVELWVDCQGQVAWKRPRCRGPSNEVRLLLIFKHWESDDNSRVKIANYLITP